MLTLLCIWNFRQFWWLDAEILTKYIKNAPKWFFPQFVTPKFFFQKSGSVTFVPLWCPKFMQKIRKTNERSLRYLKTHQQTNGQGRLLRTPSREPWVQNMKLDTYLMMISHECLKVAILAGRHFHKFYFLILEP